MPPTMDSIEEVTTGVSARHMLTQMVLMQHHMGQYAQSEGAHLAHLGVVIAEDMEPALARNLSTASGALELGHKGEGGQ